MLESMPSTPATKTGFKGGDPRVAGRKGGLSAQKRAVEAQRKPKQLADAAMTNLVVIRLQVTKMLARRRLTDRERLEACKVLADVESRILDRTRGRPAPETAERASPETYAAILEQMTSHKVYSGKSDASGQTSGTDELDRPTDGPTDGPDAP